MWNPTSSSMSELKFNCPACGKGIKCESWRSNTMMECPSCFQRVIVPRGPAGDDMELIIKGSKATRRLATKPEASLGMPPAPIRPAKDSPVAGIVLVILLCAAVAALFMFRGVIFKSSPTEATPVDNAPGTPSSPAPVSPTATAPVPAGDIALGKPANASSEETAKGNLIKNGNDGNTATRWCASSGNLPQWWEVDLGDATTITNIQIMWERDTPYQYVIEVSSNRTNWTVVADKTSNTVPAQTSSDRFSAKGRYVRLVITGLQEGSWASFCEFQAFGPSDGQK